MEKLRLDNEESKKSTLDELAKLEDAMKQRDREMEKLDQAVECRRKTGQTQDEEVGGGSIILSIIVRKPAFNFFVLAPRL